jgi:hypothetical protein
MEITNQKLTGSVESIAKEPSLGSKLSQSFQNLMAKPGSLLIPRTPAAKEISGPVLNQGTL